jgi:HSP20 family protein
MIPARLDCVRFHLPVSPFADIVMTKSNFQIQVELPGVKKEDIGLVLEKGQLRLTFEKKAVDLEGTKQVQIEREFGEFNRVFKIPESVQLDKLAAVLENGVLTVSIPKKEEQKIEIQ